MTAVPESIKKQIAHPQPDWNQFRAVITGTARPQRVHLAELFADQEIMQWFTENLFQTKWVPAPPDDNRQQAQQHLLCEINYWHRMGYDYLRVSGGLDFPTSTLYAENTAELACNQRGWANLNQGLIQTWQDFEQYPWPQIKEENLWMYDFVARNLPPGMGLMICPLSGFLEIPLDLLIGYQALSLMVYDDPKLVAAVFDRCRQLVVGTYKTLIDIPEVVGCFQGDDMGYRTATLMPPDFLKKHSLPGHREVARMAHSKGKLYFLHSCGNLEQIMDYLIDDIGIDAKHSFEDAIIPVEKTYDKYGSRVALLGGLDVDLLAAADGATVRRRSRQIIQHCVPNGRFAFGSGNTLTNYCKPQNVLAMFDQAYQWTP